MKKIKKKIYKILYKVVLSYYARKTRKRIKKNHTITNTVLLVKYDGIGDFVLFLDAAKGLREFYKDKRLILTCSLGSAGIAESTGYFDGVFCYCREDFELKNLKRTYRRLEELKCDILLQPTQPRHLFADVMCYLVEAREKIASAGELGAYTKEEKAFSDSIYDRLIEQGLYNMSLVQSANFLRGVGYTNYKAKLPQIENIENFRIYLPNNFFVVFLGGSIYNKVWDPQKYYQAAQHIQSQTGWECILCGDDYDQEYAKEFDLNKGLSFYNYIGNTKIIEQLIYIISKAKLVIGNDTSVIHIANAVNVQSICIAGNFAGEKFYPYNSEVTESNRKKPVFLTHKDKCFACTLHGNNYECINNDYFAHRKIQCVSEVTLDEVIRNIDKVLGELGKA